MAPQPGLWKKRILIPFWIVRICIMIFLIAIYAWTLRALKDYKDIVQPAWGAVIVFLLFIIIVLLLDVLAIVLFLRDALKPLNFLIMNCFQTAFWLAVLIMDFVSVGQGSSAVGIGFSIFVFLSFVGLLIYAIIGYVRAKKTAQRGQYAPAHNPVAPVDAPYPTQYHADPQYHQNTAYHSPMDAPVELESQSLPPYQAGATGEYYHQQPMKPAHIV